MSRQTWGLLLMLFVVANDVCATNYTLRQPIEEICGKYKPRGDQNQTLSGYAARKGEFPSHVLVETEFASGARLDCGGTIISERLIVTAAQCTRLSKTSLVRAGIGVGENRRSVKEKSLAQKGLSVTHFCTPEELPETGENAGRSKSAIGILVLKEALLFTQNVQPACMPPSELGMSHKAYAVGFGMMGANRTADELRVLHVHRPLRCKLDSSLNDLCLSSSHPENTGKNCAGELTFFIPAASG